MRWSTILLAALLMSLENPVALIAQSQFGSSGSSSGGMGSSGGSMGGLGGGMGSSGGSMGSGLGGSMGGMGGTGTTGGMGGTSGFGQTTGQNGQMGQNGQQQGGFLGRNTNQNQFLGRNVQGQGQTGGQNANGGNRGGGARSNNQNNNNNVNNQQQGGPANARGTASQLPAIRPRQKVNFEYTKPHLAMVSVKLETRLNKVSSSVKTARNLSLSVEPSGELVMKGEVSSASEAKLAENMARLEPGVYSVRNELTYPAPASDE